MKAQDIILAVVTAVVGAAAVFLAFWVVFLVVAVAVGMVTVAVPAATLLVAVWTVYLTALAMAAIWARTRRGAPAPVGPEDPGFQVIIPAHDEEASIGATVASVSARFAEAGLPQRIIVVADNCDDGTASVAGEAGAEVFERRNEAERGKGAALRWIHGQLCERPDWQVFVVIDADTELDPGFFEALREAYARGADATQAHYAAAEEGGHWRKSLLAVAWSVFNYLRPMGRTALGATSGILGNGFGLSRRSLDVVPFSSDSIVEDIEHALLMVEKGFVVKFVPGARVRGRVEERETSARTQRIRWESGRFQLARRWIPRLLGESGPHRWIRVEAALDLSVPPLAILAAFLCLTLALSAILVDGRLVGVNLLCAALLLFVTVTGVRLSGLPMANLAALLHVPRYVVWKLSLYAKGSFWKQNKWVRTERGDAGESKE